MNFEAMSLDTEASIAKSINVASPEPMANGNYLTLGEESTRYAVSESWRNHLRLSLYSLSGLTPWRASLYWSLIAESRGAAWQSPSCRTERRIDLGNVA
jgi:hypothetical protein